MPTTLRSFAKINLGLAIGPPRPDGFHALCTLYQTLAIFDLVTVTARPVAGGTSHIRLTSNHPRVPLDGRNTAWKMVELALGQLGLAAEVAVHVDKRLPIQGGLGAGSANAAAALIGLERELGRHGIAPLPGPARLRVASAVGSDVPLFLLGGATLGLGRGEQVVPLPDLPRTPCVVAVPGVGVSTPAAFRAWDARVAAVSPQPGSPGPATLPGSSPLTSSLTSASPPGRLDELSLAYASAFAPIEGSGSAGNGISGIASATSPERKLGRPESEQGHLGRADQEGNPLLSLVRAGIENDFEQVVFPDHPPLREIKRQLLGLGTEGPAVYAALSGSGSALFGLYLTEADAGLAQQRVGSAGTETLLTETLPRSQYWPTMFAEAV